MYTMWLIYSLSKPVHGNKPHAHKVPKYLRWMMRMNILNTLMNT